MVHQKLQQRRARSAWGAAPALAESLVRKLGTGHYLTIVDEANHLDIEAMELPRYVYDLGHLGVVLFGTLRLYEIFTAGSRPAGELEQLWSRVGICEPLPGLSPACLLSVGRWPSMRNDRITKSYFRVCLICRSRSQAGYTVPPLIRK